MSGAALSGVYMLVVGGLGLYGLRDVSEGLSRYLREAEEVFLEPYTSVLPGFTLEEFERRYGKRPRLLERRDLEEGGGEVVLRAAGGALTVFLTIGNPLVATTHSYLIVEARKRGIETVLLPAPSVIDGVILETGIHVYKIGGVATLVFPEPEYGYYPVSTYEVACKNLERGVHTLLLLDLKVEKGVYMSLSDAAAVLIELEERIGRGVFRDDTLLIGVARAASPDAAVYVERLRGMLDVEPGPPPHTLVVPGLLHESEIEYLSSRWGVEKEVLYSWNSVVKTRYMSTRDT